MGNWYPVRTMKKVISNTGNSGDIIDLRGFSDGIPWKNPQIFLSLFGYFPDTNMNKYYTQVTALGNDRFKLECYAAGYTYDTAIYPGDRMSSTILYGQTHIYQGPYYGVSMEYVADSSLGTIGQTCYESGNAFKSVYTGVMEGGLSNIHVATYTANFFSETQRNGLIKVVNTGLTYGGRFRNIAVITTPTKLQSGIPISWVAVEGDL